jgi:hypothetical protein
MVHLKTNFANGTTFYPITINIFMNPGEQKQELPAQNSKQAGDEKVAQNPNPRANENIRERTDMPGTESADMEDEVGTEITDGEDG